MTETVPQPIYSMDSSSFMEWQARNYPPDVFASLVGRVDAFNG